MRIFVIFQKEWGKRIIENISQNVPNDWQIETYVMPPFLPSVIDEPEEFLPDNLPAAELLFSLGESPGVAQLIPDFVKLTKAKAVIAPVDNPLWLPKGLQNQLRLKLQSMGVDIVFPTPFCALTVRSSTNEYIKAFAEHFGRPLLEIEREDGKIRHITVIRDSPCGNISFVAENLIEVEIDKAGKRGGLLYQYYPCLAAVKLIHQAASIAETAINKALKD